MYTMFCRHKRNYVYTGQALDTLMISFGNYCPQSILIIHTKGVALSANFPISDLLQCRHSESTWLAIANEEAVQYPLSI